MKLILLIVVVVVVVVLDGGIAVAHSTGWCVDAV